MVVIVKQKFDTYMDYVRSSDSIYKNNFENLSDNAKEALNVIYDNYEIDSEGLLNPSKLWTNSIKFWSNEECLVNNLKLLTKDEYLVLVNKGLIDDYIDKESDLIFETFDKLDCFGLQYENNRWTVLKIK